MPAKFFTNQNINELYSKFAVRNLSNQSNQIKVSLGDLIQRILFHLISFRIKPLTEQKIDLSKISNILLIRNDGLGDYIQSTPFISTIKKINPKINIDVLASKRNYQLIQEDNNIRNVYVIDDKPNFFQIYKISRQIKKHNDYDVIFALKHTKTTLNALISILTSRKAIKVNFFHSNYFRNKTYKLVFSNMIKFTNDTFHWSSFMKNMLQGIIPDNIINSFVPTYVLSEDFTFKNQKKNELVDLLQTEQLNILVNISANESNRQLDIIKVSSLINHFIDNYKMRITVTASPKDYSKLDYLKKIQNKNSNIEILKTSLIDLIHKLNQFDIVISPDTGIIHFADALRIPIIGVYENYDKISKWHPLKSQFVAIIPEDLNFSLINEKEITQALKALGYNLHKLKK